MSFHREPVRCRIAVDLRKLGATRAELTHRVVVREASLPDICREMYFVVRGLRLDVSYWLPIYSRRGWMEIFCTAHEGEVASDGT